MTIEIVKRRVKWAIVHILRDATAYETSERVLACEKIAKLLCALFRLCEHCPLCDSSSSSPIMPCQNNYLGSSVHFYLLACLLSTLWTETTKQIQGKLDVSFSSSPSEADIVLGRCHALLELVHMNWLNERLGLVKRIPIFIVCICACVCICICVNTHMKDRAGKSASN